MTRSGQSELRAIEEADDVSFLKRDRAQTITYVGANSTALHSSAYVKLLARRLHHAFYYDELAILEIPPGAQEDRSGWASTLAGLLRSQGFKLPFLRTKSVLLAEGDILPWLLEQQGCDVELLCHFTDPIDRLFFPGPRAPKSIDIVADRSLLDREVYEDFLSTALTFRPLIHWTG
ncbi:hypothetical protein SAMN02799631_00775 [Methylobacterium sp. 174MFSha1.1]|nr:hypothetical protein SAMN02799631_00775 [Methylobacterium sp. 174MFSha1.1]